MGLELIEDSELGALAPSRLGNKCFIDDDRYANLSWVSKGEKNRRAESIPCRGCKTFPEIYR